jgi:hypothetical protein
LFFFFHPFDDNIRAFLIADVSIRDLMGREISHQYIQNGEPVELAHILGGLYLVLATTPSGRAFSGKLRKE